MKTLQKAIALSLSKGFTLIELLIVIAVLGVLAVAVLSAINPIEQINRGRDTGSRSDAEQILSAVDRYYAAQQSYPWNEGGLAADDKIAALTAVDILPNVGGGVGRTLMLQVLTDVGGGSGELKSAFVTRVSAFAGDRKLLIYNMGTSGTSTYVCFVPQSGSFDTEARKRCVAGRPTDVEIGVWSEICGAGGSTDDRYLSCLP